MIEFLKRLFRRNTEDKEPEEFTYTSEKRMNRQRVNESSESDDYLYFTPILFDNRPDSDSSDSSDSSGMSDSGGFGSSGMSDGGMSDGGGL